MKYKSRGSEVFVLGGHFLQAVDGTRQGLLANVAALAIRELHKVAEHGVLVWCLVDEWSKRKRMLHSTISIEIGDQ